MKDKISILITAFNSQDYIEECLDSIENQTYFKDNNNFEILVAVDNHLETLEKLKKIKGKYRNLRIFNSVKNVGTYILRNSLIEISTGKFILFFDSDDILNKGAIKKLVSVNNDYIKFYHKNYNVNDKDNKIMSVRPTDGVFWISKKLFNKSGGFQPWFCGADSEFHKRLQKNNYKSKVIKDSLFLRRVHNTNLTNKTQVTGLGSKLRNSYSKWLRVNTCWKLYVSPIRISLTEIK